MINMKKFFAAIFLGAAIFLSGCSSDTAQSDEHVTGAETNSPVAKTVPHFTAKTIDGETVTEKIFATKKITLVNIWGTFCPPCIAEMPELGEMAKTLPDDAQIVGLVCDVAEDSPQIKKAQQITQKAGANFVNIVPDAQLMNFMENVEVVPTTIFINSKGEVVGKVILGADLKSYKSELEKLLKN